MKCADDELEEPYLNELTPIAGEGRYLAIRIHYQKSDGVNTTNVPELDGRTPLMHAVAAKEPYCVYALLQFDANPNISANDGSTPLSIATRQGQKDIMEFLIEFGVNLDARDPEGRNALMIAASRGDSEIVEFLVRNGAVITPDVIAATSMWHVEIADYLEKEMVFRSQERFAGLRIEG